jgi:hypothetical protein
MLQKETLAVQYQCFEWLQLRRRECFGLLKHSLLKAVKAAWARRGLR